MRHSAPTRLCDCASFVLWLNCGVLVHVYCPTCIPCVDYPGGGMGLQRLVVLWGHCTCLLSSLTQSGDEAQCTDKDLWLCVVCSVIELWGPCTCLLS